MTLYINCCVREESRTDRLARAVLQKLGGDFTELKLYEEKRSGESVVTVDCHICFYPDRGNCTVT